MTTYCLSVKSRFDPILKLLRMMRVEETVYVEAGSLKEAIEIYKKRHH